LNLYLGSIPIKAIPLWAITHIFRVHNPCFHKLSTSVTSEFTARGGSLAKGEMPTETTRKNKIYL
jgi:hypothetical protein